MKCPICGAGGAACGPAGTALNPIDLPVRKEPVMGDTSALHQYRVVSGTTETVLKLTEADAKKRGLTDADRVDTTATKARTTTANKARGAANKSLKE